MLWVLQARPVATGDSEVGAAARRAGGSVGGGGRPSTSPAAPGLTHHCPLPALFSAAARPCQPHELSPVGQRGVVSQGFAIHRESGRLLTPRRLLVAGGQPDGDPGEVTARQGWGACSLRTLPQKQERMHLQQVSRTQRQIIELTLNAVIDGIVIKPREKGQAKFRKCEPAFQVQQRC